MRKSYTKRDVICRFRLCEAHDFRRTNLTCPQIKRAEIAAWFRRCSGTSKRRDEHARRHESLSCLVKAMSLELTIASNAPAARK
jgi:hypothetical protein